MGLLIVAIANGALREALLVPWLGPAAAHVISTLLLSAAIILVTLASIRWVDPPAARDALAVGLGWTLLTVLFEFGAGHYVFGRPWRALAADYDVLAGRVWVLVLVATAMSPYVARRIAGRRRQCSS